MAQTRTMIVDDHEDLRIMVRLMIELADDGLTVACEAADGREALDRLETCRPDVVVLDELMPLMSGLETAEVMLGRRPDQAIVLFSAHLTPALRERATDLGIRACLPKEAFTELVDTIRKVV